MPELSSTSPEPCNRNKAIANAGEKQHKTNVIRELHYLGYIAMGDERKGLEILLPYEETLHLIRSQQQNSPSPDQRDAS